MLLQSTEEHYCARPHPKGAFAGVEANRNLRAQLETDEVFYVVKYSLSLFYCIPGGRREFIMWWVLTLFYSELPVTLKIQVVFSGSYFSCNSDPTSGEGHQCSFSVEVTLSELVGLKIWFTWPGLGSQSRWVTCLYPHSTQPALSVVMSQQSTANYVSPPSFLDEAESTSYHLRRLLGACNSPVSCSKEKSQGSVMKGTLSPPLETRNSLPCLQLKMSQPARGISACCLLTCMSCEFAGLGTQTWCNGEPESASSKKANYDTYITVEKSSSTRIMLAASLLTSVPAFPIAIPISADLRATASFTPSPVIDTTAPALCKACESGEKRDSEARRRWVHPVGSHRICSNVERAEAPLDLRVPPTQQPAEDKAQTTNSGTGFSGAWRISQLQQELQEGSKALRNRSPDGMLANTSPVSFKWARPDLRRNANVAAVNSANALAWLLWSFNLSWACLGRPAGLENRVPPPIHPIFARGC